MGLLRSLPFDGCCHIRCSVIGIMILTTHGGGMKIILYSSITYGRWTSSLPSCLRSLRIFPSLPGARLTIFYRDASSAILQLVNQWLNFTFSRSHAFRYGRKNTNPTLVRIELTTSALAGVQVTYYTTRATSYLVLIIYIVLILFIVLIL